ncbi:C1 family peptidase [Roseateles violae]|uniref:C1 family peptidase n=1 Tax=Roseateles violae TaxID=3058042 RepID=A0ABT8DJV8_9BURK|nr:C1 family peptidase [Pelomonas sp. PFR6]MDN3918715.1 C1 family peptidase [Pelomonas sp. PFR6]
MASKKAPSASATKKAGKAAAPVDSIKQRALDARPDRLDFRDLVYRAPLRCLSPRYPDDATLKRFLPGYVKAGLVLNQGSEGACTGFGLACVGNYLLWRRQVLSGGKTTMASVSPRMFYELAKHYDEWPGQDYEGSSCRGALKGWHKHGVCADKLWPYPLDADGKPLFVRPGPGWAEDAVSRPLGVYYRVDKLSVVDLQGAIAEIGAVYVSGTAHDGWDAVMQKLGKARAAPRSHDELPVIGTMKDPAHSGGHAFALVGYNERGFVIQNSWGLEWGASGFATLPYEDWVTNATDAWAVALGVPQLRGERGGAVAGGASGRASAFRVPLGRSMIGLARTSAVTDNPPDDPWPIDHEFNYPPYQPWSTPRAYQHTLLSGNEGLLMVTDFTRQRGDREGLAQELLLERPLAWQRAGKRKTLKLALYAHGGLNSESEALQRTRVLAPYFEANEIYPIFLTWRTGPVETITSMVEDWARHLLGLSDERSGGWLNLGEAKDRALEAASRVLGRGLWSEMRENAAAAGEPGHALTLAALQLRALRDQLAQDGAALELHLIGHSAGSILLGHLLDLLVGPEPLPVQSCHLYAAACSVDFAVRHYLGAAQAGALPLERLHLYQLSDGNERADGLPKPSLPIYGKSLLYLVSRALDDLRKQPLLGMERALLPAYARDAEQWAASALPAVQQWQKAWGPLAAKNALSHTITTPKVRNTREQCQISATHGSFDNNIEVLTDTLARIKGAPLVREMEWLDY